MLQNDYVRLKMQTDDELKTLKVQVSELQRVHTIYVKTHDKWLIVIVLS